MDNSNRKKRTAIGNPAKQDGTNDERGPAARRRKKKEEENSFLAAFLAAETANRKANERRDRKEEKKECRRNRRERRRTHESMAGTFSKAYQTIGDQIQLW